MNATTTLPTVQHEIDQFGPMTTPTPPTRHCSQAGVQAWKGSAAYAPRPAGVTAPAGPPPPRLFPTDGRTPHMATPRRLRITIEVDDDGGPEDYDRIMDGLSSIGAEVIDEHDVPR